MGDKNSSKSKNQSANASTEDSKNATNGYMARGNSGKISAQQGTKNKK